LGLQGGVPSAWSPSLSLEVLAWPISLLAVTAFWYRAIASSLPALALETSLTPLLRSATVAIVSLLTLTVRWVFRCREPEGLDLSVTIPRPVHRPEVGEREPNVLRYSAHPLMISKMVPPSIN
jgi:hypothetical protein